jgi:GntR family transcriptional repressor for pyruvate dehydrogenase complex
MAAGQIAEAIATGRWQPNSLLPSERDLADMFQISRSSVRQALTALEAVGVIRKKAGVGSFIEEDALEIIEQELVTELVHEGDPTMLTETRAVLEPGMAEVAARSRTEEDLAAIGAKLEEMEGFARGELSSAQYVDADIDFHMCIAMATHNPLLVRLYREVFEQMRQRVWLTAALPVVERRAAQYQVHHCDIFEAIRAREASRAGRLMRSHLRSIRANLLDISAIATESVPGK